MNRQLRKEITKQNNLIINRTTDISRSKSTSPLYFSRNNGYINNRYDRILNLWSAYLLKNYRGIYLDERWKHIEKAKKEIKRFRKLRFEKNINTDNIRTYVNGVIEDVFNAITNGKRERYLTSRLIQLRNNQAVTMRAFLEEDEIKQIINEAESYPDARKTLIDKLLDYSEDGKTIAVDTISGGVRHYDVKYYADMALRTVVRDIQTQATLKAANEVGSDLVQVSVHNTICPICYSKDTEIYTKSGWKLIKDVKKEDSVITYNIITNKIEWSKVKKIIKSYADELISFKGKQLNIRVTKNHNMLCQNDYKSRYNKFEYDIKKAEKLLNDNYSRFYAGCETWEGNRVGFDYAEFMGYYLSEGSVYKEGENNYRITISQSRNANKLKYKKIKDCCENYLKWHNIKDRGNGVSFNSTKLGKYLIQFGKANKKYIPEDIMNADKQCIRMFLDAFCLGDGNIRKSKWFKNGKTYESKTYITSSKRMADQITELLLKVGKRPTYRLVKTSGKVCKFNNGYYTINNDTHIIYESKNIYLRLKKIDKNIIEYNDKVYCVEAEKNNIIYIRREGKPIWCGNCIPFEGKIYSVSGSSQLFPPLEDQPPYHPNCLHSLSVVFIETLYRRGIDPYIQFSQGNLDVHPTAKGWIPIAERSLS